MKRLFSIYLLFQLCSAVMAQTKLPVVYLTGEFGNEYSRGTMVVKDTLGQATDTLNIRAKFRGGTSKMYDKKNFAVKLYDDNWESMDYSFFGMRSDNNWILDAMAVDKARMRNRVAFDIWRDFGTKAYYSEKEPKAKLYTEGLFVELFINEEYRGLYCFTEKIDRKQLKLKKFKGSDIKGLLYKGNNWYGTQWWDDPTDFDDTSETYQGFECQYPDLDDLGFTDWQPLVDKQSFVRFSSDDDFAANYANEFDIPVLQDIFILVNSIGAIDNSGKNLFFSIYDKTADNKMSFVPWDMDCTFGRSFDSSVYPKAYTHIFFMTNLTTRIESLAPDFFYNVAERYFILRNDILSADSLKRRFDAYFTLFANSGVGARETERWSGANGIVLDFTEEQIFINDFIDKRLLVVDDYFNSLIKASSLSSTIIYNNNQESDNNYYNLLGQRISEPVPGHIYIHKGRKIVK